VFLLLRRLTTERDAKATNAATWSRSERSGIGTQQTSETYAGYVC